ncbi:class I SAM-dependent DNA methyltransferase [Caviibacter abscessus]|uniref:class I SAM-dependent DNA methyltransferase n=1 Tax=Caviibacter abscessus TaxID=1766719 RepID=UPI000832F9D2|nr:class I SAM-dependent methyltransferase [Caviibacter abscessus]
MHKKFAYVYDEFTKNVDYESWFKFLRRYLNKKGKLLDIGCGTASITTMFRKYGYDTTGIDISQDMLAVARKKDDKIKYYNLDITKEKLNEKFDYITCNFDTVNYFSGYEALNSFIENCSSMQSKGGILIFDLVELEIFDEMFENDIFIDEEVNYTAIFRHEDLKDNKHLVEITAFIKNEDESYSKYIEKHIKYIYDINKVIQMLNDKGYNIYDIAKNEMYGESRLFIIANKMR